VADMERAVGERQGGRDEQGTRGTHARMIADSPLSADRPGAVSRCP
jgi:hypothetical protein